jgi:hypothetical protein
MAYGIHVFVCFVDAAAVFPAHVLVTKMLVTGKKVSNTSSTADAAARPDAVGVDCEGAIFCKNFLSHEDTRWTS